MDSLAWLQQFHFIRPAWLLALIPLALLIWLYARSQKHSRSWASVIDKRLLPHLLQGVSARKKPVPIVTLFIIGALMVFALAGPAFEKRPEPVFKAQSALVIILDLSRSMDATDIKPSRLSRAHFKIKDILKQRKEGQTALIVYAADAFAVSPLTDDADTIIAQIPALQTSIMPSQGSRLDIALEKAKALFMNAGHSKGHIFIISDSIKPAAQNTIQQLNKDGFMSSVLAIGSEEGAPIAAQGGGFVKDQHGAIVVPRMDIRSMQKAALAGGGKFSLLSASDSDIHKLMSSIDIDRDKTGQEQVDASGSQFKTDVWHEEGPWLLLLVIPFAAYAFRKGLVFLLLVFILPMPQPAQAFDWSSLWKNSDQRGEAALQKGEAEKAAELFSDPEWKAAAQYKAGQYQQAAEQLQNIDTAEANYNRGNALAKAGQLDQAIEAYDRTLQLQPEHEDAIYNKNILEQAKQQQQSQQNQQGDEQQQDKNQQGDQSQQSDSQSSDQKNGDQGSEQQQSQSDTDKQSANESESQQSQDQQGEESEQQSAQSAEEKEQAEKQAQQQAAKDAEKESEEKGDEQAKAQQQSSSEASPDLDQQQTQQWLKKIPDDPGGLLRRKFKYQYGQDKKQAEKEPW